MRTRRFIQTLISEGYTVEVYSDEPTSVEQGVTHRYLERPWFIFVRGRTLAATRRILFRCAVRAVLCLARQRADRLIGRVGMVLLGTKLAQRRMMAHKALVFINDVLLVPSFTGALGKGVAVILDSRDFPTEVRAESPAWRILFRPAMIHLSRAYLPLCDLVLAPSEQQAESLKIKFCAETIVWRSIPDLHQGNESEPGSRPLRVVYAGKAEGNRGLFDFLRVVNRHSPNTYVDLFLAASPLFIFFIRLRYLFNGRVCLRPQVPATHLVRTMKGFDFGFVGFKPVNDNLVSAAPNKFFEYLHAHLPVLVFEGTQMASIVEEFKCGVVLPCEAGGLAKTVVDRLTLETADELQAGVQVAISEWQADKERSRLVDAITELGFRTDDGGRRYGFS